MKLVIGGATGFVGREVLRQALRCPQITSIVALGRRAVAVEEQDREKVTDIVMMDDGENYSESALEKIADSDACIWTIGVTMTKSRTTPFEEVKRVTRDYTLAAIDALTKTNATGKPLRFIYVGGLAASRDLNQDWDRLKPLMKPEVLKLRSMLEIELVDYAAKSEAKVEVCCVRPGYIIGDREILGWKPPVYGREVPSVKLEDMATAMLKQCVEGIEKDPIMNDELVTIGQEALPRYS